MKKILKKIGSVVLALSVAVSTLMIPSSSAQAAQGPIFYYGGVSPNQVINEIIAKAGSAGSLRATTQSPAISFSQTTLASGSKYITLRGGGDFNRSFNLLYASMDGAGAATSMKYTELITYSALDNGNCPASISAGTRYNPFANIPIGSRLTIGTIFYLEGNPKDYTFTGVAAKDDGMETGSFYICPEMFNGGGYFVEESTFWIGKNNTYTPTKDTSNFAIFILRGETGDASMGANSTYPITWNSSEYTQYGLESGFAMSDYKYMYIVYKPFKYTIKKNVNGTVTPIGTVSRYGVNAVSVSSSTPTGYHFVDWTVQEDKDADGMANGTNNKTGIDSATMTKMCSPDYFYSVMFQDAVITANYAPNNYTLNFYPKGGNVSPTSKTVTYDASCGDLPTPTRTGYNFVGWFDTDTTSGGTEYTSSTVYKKAGNTNLYARWTPINYTINYNANGGSGYMTPSSHTYNANKNLSGNAFSRTGYIFSGWNTQPNGSGTNFTNGQNVVNLTATNGAAINLYAQWTPISYSISYDANRPMSPVQSSSTPTGSMPNTNHTYDAPTPLRPNAYSLKGWWFSGWNLKLNI